MLNNVRFNTVAGGLGRLPEGKDHVSSIIMSIASPAAWADTLGKKYLSIGQAENDGITEGDATYGLLWYFIHEFFRMSGPSELYIINESDATFSAQDFHSFTDGEVRQIFWYKSDSTYATIGAAVATMKTFSEALEALYAPLVILTNIKDEATDVDGGITDLRPLNAPTVSVINSGDGSGKGKELATSLGVKYIPAGGTFLGLLSKASVNESIAWVGRFPLASVYDFTKVVLSDGKTVRSTPETTLVQIDDLGYLFARNHAGISGTYVNDTHTAVVSTSDFSYLETNRTMGKAKRGIRAILLPDLNAPLQVEEDGTLSPDTIEYFKTKTGKPLDLMLNAGEISNYQVLVDPEQDVLTTSKLIIQVKIQPKGVARDIVVNIGFAVNIAA